MFWSLKLSGGVTRRFSHHAGKTLPWDRFVLFCSGRVGLALLKLRVELGMKPTSWLSCGFDLNYGETITSHHNLGSATNISTSGFFSPPSFLFCALGIFLLCLDSHNFGSLTSEQCWQLCMPVLTSQPCTATYSCTAHKPLQSEGQTTPGKIKELLICLLPTPFILKP